MSIFSAYASYRLYFQVTQVTQVINNKLRNITITSWRHTYFYLTAPHTKPRFVDL